MQGLVNGMASNSTIQQSSHWYLALFTLLYAKICVGGMMHRSKCRYIGRNALYWHNFTISCA